MTTTPTESAHSATIETHLDVHIMPVRTYLIVFGVLIALLATTIGAAFLPIGDFSLPLALGIAATKAILIMMYFMHLKFSSRLTWIFAGGAFFWLGLLIVITLGDYLSRGWLAVDGK